MANIDPIFPATIKSPIVAPVLTANTNLDGTGTVVEIYQSPNAGAGSIIYGINVMRRDSAATVQTLRLFLNNGSSNTIATNNTLLKEITIPAITLSGASATPEIWVPLNLFLQANYRLYTAVHSGYTNGLAIVPFIGDY